MDEGFGEMAILASDDEIVAAAVRSAHPWRGLLPSLDLGIDGVLPVAAARGARSLRIRGLLAGDDADFTERALDLGRVTSGEVVLRCFTALADAPLQPIGPGIVVVVSGAEVLVDLTVADGTHDIAPVGSVSAAWDVVANTLRAVRQDGLSESRVFTAVADDGTVVVAERRSVRLFELDLSDGRPVLAEAAGEPLERLEAAWRRRAAALEAS